MNNAICSNIDEPRNYHTEPSKSERERQMPDDIIYMWNLKYDTNEPMYEKETDSQTKEQTGGFQEGGEWGREGLGF